VVDQSNGVIIKIAERQLSLYTRYLPALYIKPIEEPAVKRYSAWTGFVNGRQVYALAAGANELWCATSGGILRLKWAGNVHYTWFRSEHGLPGIRFEWIVLDGCGYLWVASKTLGVCYWNGQIWRQLSLVEKLPSDHITCLAVDSMGTIWIATKHGLGYIDWQDEKPEWHLYDLITIGIPTLQFTCLAFDDKNRLYVGTASGLFTSAQGENTWRRYTLADGLPCNWITTLLCSEDGNVWVGTASGLVYITPNGIVNCPEIKTTVHAISQEPDKNHIWILASGKLWRCQDGNFEHLDIPLFEKTGNLYTITVSSEKLWVGSEVGVIEYNKAPALIRTPGIQNLPDGGINSLAIDVQNNLWVGTTLGVWVYQNQEWRFLHPDNQLIAHIANISGIQAMADGTVWVGSWQNGNGGGLHLFRSGVEMPCDRTNMPEVVDAMTLSMASSAIECLWIASGGRLYYQEGKEWHQVDGPEPGGVILKLLVDQQNHVWCGLSTGLYVQKRNKWKKILNVAIYALAIDSGGAIWCGTSKGVYTIRRESPELLELDLPSNRVRTLYLIDDVVWIGTASGLVRLKNGSTQVWDTKNSGLSGQNVTTLILGDDHVLWVGTTNGLCQFDISKK
jgi:ligand-binding sensor domain-containing protein